MLTAVVKSLKHRLALPLPGSEAQLKMANAERRMNLSRMKIPDNPRKGAVMILLYETSNSIRFPLIVRPMYHGVHSGQVALPGGSFDENDKNLQATAVREAEEETGIISKNVTVLGQLSEIYIPPSNFLVTPFIAVHSSKPVFNPDSHEVARIVEIDLESIMDEKLIREKNITLSNGIEISTPYFDLKGLVVWGATAMILSEFRTVVYETGH